MWSHISLIFLLKQLSIGKRLSSFVRQLALQNPFTFVFSVACLKELKIFVPEAVIMGNAATLTCQYDLDDVSFFVCALLLDAD